jgi:hypothetical protein
MDLPARGVLRQDLLRADGLQPSNRRLQLRPALRIRPLIRRLQFGVTSDQMKFLMFALPSTG